MQEALAEAVEAIEEHEELGLDEEDYGCCTVESCEVFEVVNHQEIDVDALRKKKSEEKAERKARKKQSQKRKEYERLKAEFEKTD